MRGANTIPIMEAGELCDCFVKQIKRTYQAESCLQNTLPLMAGVAVIPELSRVLCVRWNETLSHLERLHEIFHRMECTLDPEARERFYDLICENDGSFDCTIVQCVIDDRLIDAALRIDSQLIADYYALCDYARWLGHDDITHLLWSNLVEVRQTSQILSELSCEVLLMRSAASYN